MNTPHNKADTPARVNNKKGIRAFWCDYFEKYPEPGKFESMNKLRREFLKKRKLAP